MRRRRLGGGAAAFDPRTLGTVALWLKADALSLADGTAIATAVDSSGSGNTPAQATGAKQPLFKVGIQNGLPGILFDGVNDCLQTPSFSTTTHTILLVIKLTGTAGILIEQGANAGANDGLAMYGSLTDTIDLHRSANFNQRGYATNWAVDNVARMVTWSQDGTHAGNLFYIDGTNQSLTNITTNNIGTAAATQILNIGSRNNGASLPCSGYFFELIVFSSQISLANQRTAEAALRKKWGTP